ncbi:basic proline-rich protein-like [Cebus imitator]|uniref:basic proline-rich protein-like n=1 Tax=Cebus imitator TaxID=2715852 RepID=UPI0018985F3F|nr:basic proline-rich protein-like [Cebus imitator]
MPRQEAAAAGGCGSGRAAAAAAFRPPRSPRDRLLKGPPAPGPGARGPRLQEALPAPRSAFPGDPRRAAQTPGGPAKRPRARSPLSGPLPPPPSLCWRGAAAGSPPQTRAVAPRVPGACFTCSGCARPAATPAGRSRRPLTRSDPGRCDHRLAARLGPHIHELQGGLPKTTLPLQDTRPSRFRGKPPRRPPCELLSGRSPPTAVGTAPRARRGRGESGAGRTRA